MKSESKKEKVLSFDIRRSIILSMYIKEWSMPEYRVILENKRNSVLIEIYYFPSVSNNSPARFASIGLSNTLRKTGQPVNAEWMLALEKGLGGESISRIFSYFSDLISHNIENIESSEPPRVLGESHLSPERWTTKAILIDELRGESDSLEHIKIGEETIDVLWVVPINKKELELISKNGIEVFDDYVNEISYSIIDPTRPDQ
ncbi:suppressor of fused domain protein [Delftia tsuruhatensis]